MVILAIETSCDDTSIAVLKAKNGSFEVLSNVISSQVKIHAKYGGVVPNLASREHQKNIQPCLKKALKSASLNLKFGSLNSFTNNIDLIAVTIGPGLIPALLVGVNFAKALAYNLQKPIIGINHIEGHIYANWLPASEKLTKANKIVFPALCLLVSGGHTQLILIKNHSDYKLLGETRDDAAGEAFDKVAKMLGLPYPGGPAIAERAEKWQSKYPTLTLPLLREGKRKEANIPNIKFARPMISAKNYDFSFSGIKTSVLYKTKELPELTPKIKSQICYEFQQAVIDVLIHKTIKAAKEYKVKTLLLSGGVAANKELRRQIKEIIQKQIPDTTFYIPEPVYCTDNAAMIGAAAYFQKRQAGSWSEINADANLRLLNN